MKKVLMLLASVFTLFGYLPYGQAQSEIGQTIQIYTHFNNVAGKPSWLLIVRDVNSGLVSPYVFDILNNDNFWIALAYGHSYRVTVSTLNFGHYAIIHNFCHLEDGILSGKSMILTLSGDLSPVPITSKCHILLYNGSAFPITPH